MNRVKKWLGIFLILVGVVAMVMAPEYQSPSRVLAATTRVDLLTTDGFAVLAGSAITDTGTSAITGNVGLDPTGGASITGLTCAEITGTLYDNDAGYAGGGGGVTTCRTTDSSLLTTAKANLTTAYNDAAGRTTTSTIPTELGGTTLNDGVYDSASGTFGLTGTLTLDGQGNSSAVFIFKMATTLITAASSQVVLTNSAQACNVYWQVGSSATLGTTSILVGNVLALTSITDNGGSTVNGRLLARNGAVTLNNSTVAKQTCITPTPTATATPTPTATATTSSSSSTSNSTSSSSDVGTPSTPCPTIDTGIIPPAVTSSSRVSPTSISLNWGPFSGTDKFNIRYGPADGNWLYSTDVTGFSTTINSLPSNQSVWFSIAARNDCQIGNYGESILVGGMTRISVPGFPDTGNVPRLPDTGYGPRR